ncbi:transforming growth factor-beta receptor-associated protein 1 homolog [Rhincodon typus]|uniref:transforming growth factor-beta receptor-associated protein 1 homolog n=1 Tax=Rhincodon typus TaxID=259920 RepID=UPI002030FF29|nr:transforming growth factor-beta receptor-associated protein 1 homolog [Rhincodon typus]XP_020385327.2 transforming growth factor-beta receptor-associated protein 1 homolog [Rhincodon typus]XP_020385328.2 transforming growth factor-beta receptor-associated protein 1 homolog [Rhincodon typus]XP_048454172.1 transforming growth factor-beta receptor-associated protein 1 homolog [Rhincodon typus]XP_048454173.1 transforming growth factor-beta receptor-associated protein 1 homolog [Rhincodon typus]
MSVKAFELVPVLGQDLLIGDKSWISVDCIECCGKNLYVATSDCCIYHFKLEEKASVSGRLAFTPTKQLHKYLGVKKAVNELKAASALNRLLVLCDNIVILMDMISLEPVPSGAKIKGITAFVVNENPVTGDPFCIEVCAISMKRKTVQMYTVHEDRVQLIKEISTPEQPVAMAVDGYFLCLAMSTQYIILSYNTGTSQDLFPYNSEDKQPIVKRIGREEFLLAGPGALGMFVTAAGISQRAPVHWSENVIGAAVCFPYVVALDEEFVTVHSMLDQQQKQSIPFRDGHILQDFEGKLILATSKEVYILVPLPLEKQIQDLLTSQRVEEALLLTRGARRNVPKEKFQGMYRRILQQAGFIQFGQLQFLEAKELFRNGQLDVRELMSLYPLLLPSTSTFIRSHPPLHEYADLNQLMQGDQEKITKCKRFLMSYLNEIRSTEIANGYKEDIDTALLKLYAEANHDSLLDLLVSENSCLLVDSIPWLEKHKKYFALGLLYHYNGQNEAALQLWVKIVEGQLQDTTRSDLFEYIVDFLSFCSNHELVWKYADWALQKNEEVGVQIFTRRPLDESQTSMNPDDIVNYLHKYKKAVVMYLEHLVFDRNVQKEKYHTHLAILYLDKVLELHSQSGSISEELISARRSLKNLLQHSNLYRVHLLLGKIKDTDLYMECAILHGKLEEHEKALEILVHKLKDFEAAEDYCLWNSNRKDSTCRQRLFHMLLALYLQPGVTSDALAMAGVDLLNNHAVEFDAVRVLQQVPDNWSIQLLSPFLTRAIRGSFHSKCTAELTSGLARSENLNYKYAKVKSRGNIITLSDKKVCQICQGFFTEPIFVRYPDGGLAHIQCTTKHHSLPATDQNFASRRNVMK